MVFCGFTVKGVYAMSINSVVMFPLSKLDIDAAQFQMRMLDFGRTAAQIEREGINLDKLQPILAVRAEELYGKPSDRAVIVDGHSRFKGYSALVVKDATAKLPTALKAEDGEWMVPVQFVSVQSAQTLACVMNESRDQHSDYESARAACRLHKQGRTVSAIATLMGKSQSWVRVRLNLGNISAPLAREILEADDGISTAAARHFGKMCGEKDIGADLQAQIWNTVFKPLRSKRTGGIPEATMKRYVEAVSKIIADDPTGARVMELAETESAKLNEIGNKIANTQAVIMILTVGTKLAEAGALTEYPEIVDAVAKYADQVKGLKESISAKALKAVA